MEYIHNKIWARKKVAILPKMGASPTALII